jgi:hypothetical protein
MPDSLDYLIRPKPHPRSPVARVARGAWETLCAIGWGAALCGAIVWSEYFGNCACGHGSFRHQRNWPRACKDCHCQTLNR